MLLWTHTIKEWSDDAVRMTINDFKGLCFFFFNTSYYEATVSVKLEVAVDSNPKNDQQVIKQLGYSTIISGVMRVYIKKAAACVTLIGTKSDRIL